MSNVVSSAIFCVRNIDKAENQGKVGRWGVAVGQAKKIADHVKTIDKNVDSAFSSLSNYAKSEKVLGYAGKAVDFAARNINPLICVSAGIDVLNSDDKEKAFVTNTTGLVSMFAVEDLMKKHLDEIPKMDCMKGVTEKVMKFAKNNKMEGKLPSIIKGVAFVAGSCAAYSIGEKFGSLVLGRPAKAEQ